MMQLITERKGDSFHIVGPAMLASPLVKGYPQVNKTIKGNECHIKKSIVDGQGLCIAKVY